MSLLRSRPSTGTSGAVVPDDDNIYNREETDALLEELQAAAEAHRRILERQSELIRLLREELKDVKR